MTTPLLRTRQLTLRPLVHDDAEAIVAALSDWEVVRWLTSVPWPYTLDDAAFFLDQIVPKAPHWAIDAGSGLIGVISVKADLGYWLARAQHGKGYMGEAAACVVAHERTRGELPMVSGHLTGNVPSRRLLLGLGFRDTVVEQVVQMATGREVAVQRMRLEHPPAVRCAEGA